MKQVTFRLEEEHVAAVDEIARTDAKLEDRSEVLRYFVRQGLQREADDG